MSECYEMQKKKKFGCNIFKNNNLPIGQWQLYDTA